ncbi:MAG: PfkB family carbohydrate kinase [Planctomycetota bacterium]|nr:PfkB family carbohydrate kinase [Planctomycetota bacterium]
MERRLAVLPKARVAVFGDFCVDAYWLIEPDDNEMSIETGLPVRRVRRQRYSLGGAGNVVANLAALGVGAVEAVGLVGEDLFGRQLLDMLGGVGAGTREMLVADSAWQTLVYAKPCIGEAEQNRIDFGAFERLSPRSVERLAEALARAAAASDVVILNQQVPAGMSPFEMIEKINAVVAAHPRCRFIVDSRHRAHLYQGAMLKVNAHEASRLLGEPRALDETVPAEQARELARRLRERTGHDVFVTRGARGILVAHAGGMEEVPGIQILEQTDPVGAGDTVVATLAAVLASGGDAVEAARLANIAASVTVRKLQTTGTATPAEIRAVGPEPDYVYLPELASDPRAARHLPGTEFEVVRPLPERRGKGEVAVRHVVFDHDGTLSTLREGWERIMEPMMLRAILGPRHDDADLGLYEKAQEVVRGFIDRTTGVQTLVQMRGLVELVRQFGCVPTDQVLDMHAYKGLYNEALMAMVRQRIAKLERGGLQPSDFQIKNARLLLERLHAKGVKLYLASGTDQGDVEAEARAMGYAGLFEGRIFGAVGKVDVEAKKVVMDRIIEEHRLEGAAMATFGDGPVEMRETHKRGGMAIGVASDEIRGFGFNPAKRSRLIAAGADLIVPDYSQLDSLLGLLGLG